MTGQEIGYLEAWSAWFDGIDIRQRLLWGLEIYWWARISKLATLLSGMVILLDIIGVDRIEAWSHQKRRNLLEAGRVRSKGLADQRLLEAAIILNGGTVWWARKRAREELPYPRQDRDIAINRWFYFVATVGILVLLSKIYPRWESIGVIHVLLLGPAESVMLVSIWCVTALVLGTSPARGVAGVAMCIYKQVDQLLRIRNAMATALRIAAAILIVAAFHFDFLAT